jgi:hypothetical protein
VEWSWARNAISAIARLTAHTLLCEFTAQHARSPANTMSLLSKCQRRPAELSSPGCVHHTMWLACCWHSQNFAQFFAHQLWCDNPNHPPRYPHQPANALGQGCRTHPATKAMQESRCFELFDASHTRRLPPRQPTKQHNTQQTNTHHKYTNTHAHTHAQRLELTFPRTFEYLGFRGILFPELLNAGICRDVVPLMMTTAGVLNPHRPVTPARQRQAEAGITPPSQHNFLTFCVQFATVVPTMVLLLVVAVALAWPSALPGCFEDSRTSRQLGHQVCLVTGGCAALTHEWCAEQCRQSGFTVAGVSV